MNNSLHEQACHCDVCGAESDMPVCGDCLDSDSLDNDDHESAHGPGRI